MDSRRVARSQWILLSAQAARLLLYLLISTMLGRALAPAGLGFVALLSALLLIVQELLDMGTSFVTSRGIAQQPDAERNALNVLLAWRRWLAAGLALLLLGLTLQGAFSHDAEQRAVMTLAALALLLLHLNAYQPVFQIRQAFGRVVALGLASQLLFLLGGLALLQFARDGRIAGLAIGTLFALLLIARELVLLLGCRWLAIRMLGYRLRSGWLNGGIPALLRRAGTFGLAGLCYRLSALSGVFFIWSLNSPEALGRFNAAQRLYGPLAESAWLFATPLLTALSVDAKTRPWALGLKLQALTQLLLALACMLAVSGQYLASFVLELLYGPTYVAGPHSAVQILQALSLAGACAILTPLLAVAHIALGLDRLVLLVSVAGLGVGLAANLVLVPRLGPLGAALALCLSEGCVVLALLASAARRRELRPDPGWLPCLLPAALLLPLLQALRTSAGAQLLACLLVIPLGLLALRRLPSQRALRAALARPGSSP